MTNPASASTEQLATPEGVPYESWTEIDADLHDCPQPLANIVRSSRVMTARFDAPRVPFWKVPDDVDVIEDLPYADDSESVRGHRLDLYLPHDAVVRGGRTLPVYVDVHGGGFVYGYKELNRNFCTHLAERGFAVFSLSYRPAPQTDFIGQLRDVEQGLSWIRDHRHEYPIAQHGVWLTGDSAGACLAFFATAIEHASFVAQGFGVEASGVGVLGAALISGVYDMSPYIPAPGVAVRQVEDPTSILHALSQPFFGALADVPAAVCEVAAIAGNVALPPIFLNTSSDDFIQAETLSLAALLAAHGIDFELHDWKVAKGESLGHVFPICMTWLAESAAVLGMIHDFTYARL
ncbi:MAG: alpha/beta hydrolase [Bifidobacterium sp.]|jgi:acetyl esterase/lipase|nr:alpha/beta hydrolase [Bifidobacterium sp.]